MFVSIIIIKLIIIVQLKIVFQDRKFINFGA